MCNSKQYIWAFFIALTAKFTVYKLLIFTLLPYKDKQSISHLLLYNDSFLIDYLFAETITVNVVVNIFSKKILSNIAMATTDFFCWQVQYLRLLSPHMDKYN